jgi:hypothetical protein
MALTGELSDLSLAELIEFFCNQRKTGRLRLIYPIGPGYFYLQAGSVVHARIGTLRGIEAVYYALTLPNASFTFSPAFEPPEHTINQPWTSVVLEGLRRMDEGIKPGDPFADEDQAKHEEFKAVEKIVATDVQPIPAHAHASEKAPVSFPANEPPKIGSVLFQSDAASGSANGRWKLGFVAAAVVVIVAVIAVPWGWYARSKAAKLANEAKTLSAATVQSSAPTVPTTDTAGPATSETTASSTTSEAADLAAKRQREARAKERAKAQEASAASSTQPSQAAVTQSIPKSQSSSPGGSKKVTVQVTYDENGRVTQASGGDATALRIARQKRFPAGKPGSATITIPIN